MRTYIDELKKHVGSEVSVAGWVDARRAHGKLIFIDLRDRTGVIQSVVTPKHEAAYAQAALLRGEWVIEARGIVNKRPEKIVNPDLETGTIELEITDIAVVGHAHELPFDKEEKLNLDTHLDHLPLTLRSARNRAIFSIQARIIEAFRIFLKKEGFVEFQSPKIIGEDAEGGASVFKIEYFDHEAHLAQSPQFYKQIMVGIYEKVFTTGNVFRAEKHSTTRHLNEYTSLDVELGFIRDHHDIMNLGGRLMHSIISHVAETSAHELKILGATLPLIPHEIPHMKLRDAQKIIHERYGEDCAKEPDLSPQHERWISEYALKQLNSDFIYITHFPSEKRPMYVYEDEADLGYTKSFDLLCRGLEVNTGGQRIHEYDDLVAKIQRKGLDPEKFSFYLQAFKYGMPPHGGFGMGLERLTARFLSIDNVKEATLFPREINRIDTLLSH